MEKEIILENIKKEYNKALDEVFDELTSYNHHNNVTLYIN